MNIEWPEINCSLGDPLLSQAFSCIPAESQCKSRPFPIWQREQPRPTLQRRVERHYTRKVSASLTPADLEIFSLTGNLFILWRKKPHLWDATFIGLGPKCRRPCQLNSNRKAEKLQLKADEIPPPSVLSDLQKGLYMLSSLPTRACFHNVQQTTSFCFTCRCWHDRRIESGQIMFTSTTELIKVSLGRCDAPFYICS